MRIGFETIGNATIIAHDKNGPIITTDPWITGSAYFGSWSLSHEVPPEQMEAVKRCAFIWFSHGHPDHLNAESLDLLRDRKILLPDHVGGRISSDLQQLGLSVSVLPDRQWVSLSDSVRVMCIADYFQNAVLLLDINGRLLVNTNDAPDRGWGRLVRRIIRDYPTSFLLALFGYGDADMINFYTEDGTFIPPKAAKKLPVGTGIAQAVESYGVKYFIPFSSMHRYQRADSLWANEYVTRLPDYARGFHSTRAEILPAFLRYDCETDRYEEIGPAPLADRSLPPEEFGDNWSDPLEAGEADEIARYFSRIEHLSGFLDFLCFRVGKKENVVPLARGRFQRGISFAAPRNSLMQAVRYRVFDDMLIGNFMKVTLHGKWPRSGLYPDFTPYVARYADNAGCYTEEEVARYLEEYRRRAPLDHLLHRVEWKSIDLFRSHVSGGSPLFQAGKKLYWQVKGLAS